MGACCNSANKTTLEEPRGRLVTAKQPTSHQPEVVKPVINSVVRPVVKEVATKKPKLNKADFMFKAQDGQTLIKMPGDINGIDFMIKDLNDCTVMLLDHTA